MTNSNYSPRCLCSNDILGTYPSIRPRRGSRLPIPAATVASFREPHLALTTPQTHDLTTTRFHSRTALQLKHSACAWHFAPLPLPSLSHLLHFVEGASDRLLVHMSRTYICSIPMSRSRARLKFIRTTVMVTADQGGAERCSPEVCSVTTLLHCGVALNHPVSAGVLLQ